MIKYYVIKVKSYHADKFRLNNTNYKSGYIKAGQRLICWGAGGHHQNEIAESMIKELRYGRCTALLHVNMK